MFPEDKSKWRYVFSPDLVFKFDGSDDTEPIHHWFPTLAVKLNAPRKLRALSFVAANDSGHIGSLLIEAAPPNNFWNFILTGM